MKPTRLQQQLIHHRKRLGLSLTQAAAKLGVSKGHLHEMEHGKTTNPTLTTLTAIQAVYGPCPCELFNK